MHTPSSAVVPGRSPVSPADWCAHHPLALAACHAHGVDPAEAAASLADACRGAGVPLAPLVDGVRAAEVALAEPWRDRPLPTLIDHLVAAYHQPFDARLAVVDAAFARAAHPAWEAARGGLAEIGADLRPHMAKEEHVLFPWLRTRSDTAAGPIRVMQLEHADFLQLLHALHGATQAAAMLAPAPAAVTAHAALESWLCEHIFLENNALFPRALGLADAEHAG